MLNNRYPILNTYVNAISMEETIAEVEEIIRAGKPTQHVVVNALKVNLMNEDEELQKIVNSCPLINADGASIVWAAKKLGVPLKERVTGIDLFLNLVKSQQKRNIRFTFLVRRKRWSRKSRISSCTNIQRFR